MLVATNRRALVLRPRVPERILNVIPTARPLVYKGETFVAVPHQLDETKVLRNLGYGAPSPIRYYYDWHGQFKPFAAQLETAEFLTLVRNAFILNDLGTGKTLSVLWAYDYLRALGMVHRGLIGALLSTLERAWGDEIYMNFPHLQFAVVHGTPARRLSLLGQEADLYIINHDGVKTNGIEPALAQRPDIDLVIIDEIAQVGRNASTDRWRALNRICNKQHPRRVWGLTATPTPNDPTDAWAQCRLISPEKVPPYFNRFRDMVMRQVGTFTWLPRDNAVDIVKEVMQPAVRFTREQCIDLPPCVYQTRHVPLTPAQTKAYKEMVNRLRTEVDGGEVVAVNEAVKIGKLLQIVCGIAYGAQGREELMLDATGRIDEVISIIEQAGTKVIVFAPFIAAVERLVVELQGKFSVARVHGDVPKTERDQIFAAFQRTADPQVLVAQPGTMSHGLTMTAANTIVWFSPITSNETYEQANGRITRPGQTHTQFIINIEGSPVERRLYERLRAKQKMQGMLLDLLQAAQGV